jgi:hypothetical protein
VRISGNGLEFVGKVLGSCKIKEEYWQRGMGWLASSQKVISDSKKK